MKDKNNSCLWRKFPDCLLKIDCGSNRRSFLSSVKRREVITSYNSCGASSFSTHFVQYDIDCKPMKPGGKRAFSPKRTDHLPCSDKNVLSQLFGTTCISQDSQTNGVYSSRSEE